MIEEGGEGARHVLAGGLRDRRQELLRGRVAVDMPPEVRLHPFAEPILADVLLEHADDRRALLIRDGVERGLDVSLALDGLADAPGREKPIGAHRALHRGSALLRLSPGRLEALDGMERHPGGERLVEPDVVPPGVGDHVAEPEVRELVRLDAGGRPAELRRLHPRLHQIDPLPEGDQARVLHRAAAERDLDQVQLRVVVRNAEPVLEQVHQLWRRERGVAGPCALSAGDHDPDRRSSLHVSRVDALEGADAERQEVARQRLRLGETHQRRLAMGLGGELRRIEVGGVALGDPQRDAPRNLVRGLVERGQDPPHPERLALGEHVPLAVLLLPEGALVVRARDAALPADRHRRVPGRKRSPELQAGEGRRGGDDGRGRLGPGDLDQVGVQPQDRQRSLDREIDLLHAGELVLARVDRQLRRHPRGPRVRRQAEMRRDQLRLRSFGPHELEGESIALPPLAGLGGRPRRSAPVARVVGIAQEAALLHQLEPRLLHLRLHHGFVDAMEGLGGVQAASVLRARVDHHVRSARPQAVEDDAVHPHPVDRQIRDGMVDDVHHHQVEVLRLRRNRIVERDLGPNHVLHGGVGEALGEAVLEEGHPARIVLHVDGAAGTDRAREELGGVAEGRSDVLDLHPRFHSKELEHRARLAPAVELAIRLGAIRGLHHRQPSPSRRRSRCRRRGLGCCDRRRCGLAGDRGTGEDQGDARHGAPSGQGRRLVSTNSRAAPPPPGHPPRISNESRD